MADTVDPSEMSDKAKKKIFIGTVVGVVIFIIFLVIIVCFIFIKPRLEGFESDYYANNTMTSCRTKCCNKPGIYFLDNLGPKELLAHLHRSQ